MSPRALVLYAALACLCVSDGVGPRLIPFPSSFPGGQAAGAGLAQALEYSAGAHAPPAAAATPVGLKLSKAGDAFKKIPVFSAPVLALPQGASAWRSIARLDRPLTLRASVRLRLGRAPPLRA